MVKGEFMIIKEVLTYDGDNYAQFIVSDGTYDLLCVCTPVTLPSGFNEPKKGMDISEIVAFAPDGMNVKRIRDDKNKVYMIKKGKNPLNYHLQSKVIDKEIGLVRIGNLIIETDELPEDVVNGDFIEFEVDRLDCDFDS